MGAGQDSGTYPPNPTLELTLILTQPQPKPQTPDLTQGRVGGTWIGYPPTPPLELTLTQTNSNPNPNSGKGRCTCCCRLSDGDRKNIKDAMKSETN